MKKAVRKDISDASHKIALLTAFMLAVACSFFVVRIKSKIRTDKPLSLVHTGFSVSLPLGEQWEIKTAHWEFNQENNYFYAGAVGKQDGVTATVVQWRYIICPERANATEIFDKKAQEYKATSSEYRVYIGDGFGAHTAYFRTQAGENIFLALAILEPGRTAELEIKSKQRYPANDVFIAMLNTAKFKVNGLISNGRKVVQSIPFFLAPDSISKSFERFYLLESEDMFEGFSAMQSQVGKAEQIVKSFTYAYSGLYEVRRRSIFSRDLGGKISWRFSQEGSKSFINNEMQLELDNNDELIITNLATKVQKKINISPSFYPEILDFELFEVFANSDIERCVVDVLMPQGQVLPMYMEKAKNSDARWQISLVYLHTPELDLRVDISHNRLIRSKILDIETQHRLNLCQREDIVARYPNQSAFLQELTN